MTSFVSDELRRSVLIEESRAKRPDLVADLENPDPVSGALKACVGALRNALQA